MKVFTKNELTVIETLLNMVNEVCFALEKMGVNSKLCEPILNVKDILERKDSKNITSIESALYEGFRALDEGQIFDDELDLLTHKTYAFVAGNNIFKGEKSSSDIVIQHEASVAPLITLLHDIDNSWNNYEAEEFIAFITPLEGLDLDANNTSVSIKPLPFYNDVDVLRVLYHDDGAEYFLAQFVKYKDEFIRCSDGLYVIDELEMKSKPIITKDNVISYLKCMLFWTANIDERAYLIEGVECEFIHELSGYEKSMYLKNFKPPEIIEMKHPKRFKITAQYNEEPRRKQRGISTLSFRPTSWEWRNP